MREGDRVRLVSGKHKGKTGEVIGPLPMGQAQDSSVVREINLEGAKIYWVIQFDDGTQDFLEESDLEIIDD